MGVTQPEKKTRRFGMADTHRTLYTPRGVREASALLGYRSWLREQKTLPAEQWRDAVLLGCTNGVDSSQLALAQALAKAFVGGAKAGRRHSGN